jgi:hypothetical protein
VALRSTPDNGAEVREVMFSKDLVSMSSLEHLKIIKIVFKLLLSPTTRLPRDEKPK